MSKKDKLPSIQMDFQLGIGGIIPSTQEAFGLGGKFSSGVRKEESKVSLDFKKVVKAQIDREIGNLKQFPSNNEFFIFIVQYFVVEKEYHTRDIDNMAKTILDLLKGKFYQDDGQVKSLLVVKKIEKRVSKNFIYFAIKELKDDRDIDVLKIAGLERSVTLFNELKSRGLVDFNSRIGL
ncbi:MAG: RusA family crossover junction endodeoxyribonuclease [bacterium]|nr:RusA family crossover junction endodeoxyribonuclease [bacterium]